MLSIKKLALKRANKLLFSSFEMQVKAGQIVVVLGPNGAGKSTLLLALFGMLEPESGEVLLENKVVQGYSRHGLAKLMTWQGDLPPTEFGLTVKQRLLLANDGNDLNDIKEALVYMDLEQLQHRVLGELSSGERQRVEIAATMVRDNPIWLMDEPTAHLDMRHQVDCLKLMKQEANQGRLIITVLHDLQQAAAVADVVVLLDGKGGIEVGEAETMLTASRLEPVFGVTLKGQGRDLMPVYHGGME